VTVDIQSLRGLDAHVSADAELAARLKELNDESDGRPFSDDQRTEFETILAQREELSASIDELKIRDAAVKAALKNPRDTEAPVSAMSAPNVIKPPADIHDLVAYRQQVTSVEDLPKAYHEGAMRVLDKATFPAHQGVKGDPRDRIEQLLAEHGDKDYGALSRRIIGTDSPLYREAWAKYISGGPQAVSGRFQAALQTYTDADGGYAIPFTIDPTFVLTTDGNLNPLREMARTVTITTKAWQPVTTGGVTASYAAETAAATDGAPTDVADGLMTPLRAHVLVAFTAEYAEDYGPAAIQAEVGRLIRDAKDLLEADKFVNGEGTTEPLGIVDALVDETTHAVNSATAATFALADVTALEGALGDRFIGGAEWLAARKIYQTIRTFGTAGSPANSIYDSLSRQLFGYDANVSNSMDKTTVTGKYPLLFGNFENFVIVDRIGLSSEFIPQIFDGSGNPLGQRGIYARWRNTSGVLVTNAFRILKIV